MLSVNLLHDCFLSLPDKLSTRVDNEHCINLQLSINFSLHVVVLRFLAVLLLSCCFLAVLPLSCCFLAVLPLSCYFLAVLSLSCCFLAVLSLSCCFLIGTEKVINFSVFSPRHSK